MSDTISINWLPMIRNPCRIAMLVAISQMGCNQILGAKDPTLNGDQPGLDAAGASDGSASSGTDASAGCMPASCPFGCNTTTNTCRDGQLWIFKTGASFLGNAFGGTDSPPDVRAGADGKCLIAYTASYSVRQCGGSNVHAILYVSASDSLSLMPIKYNIPIDVPVYRAEDGIIVSNNWNNLTDPTQALRASATTAMADDSGLVWTGQNAQATCSNWTSAVSTSLGARGYTNRTDSSWLGEDTFRCDRLASLLCICWPGAN